MENNQYFDENGHLNDAGVTLWVDALRLKREADLPEALQEHLELCKDCRVSVFEYYEFKREDDIAELANHPYFAQLDAAQANETPVVSINKNTNKEKAQPTKTVSLQRRLAVAASVVVLLVAGWMISQNLGGNKSNNGVISGKNDTTQRQKNKTDKNTEKSLAENKNSNNASKDTTSDKEQQDKTKEDKKEDKPKEDRPQEINPVFSEAIAFMDAKIAKKGATRGRDVPAPALDANFANGQGVLFEWKTGTADAFQLRVMTNKTKNNPQIIKINGGLSQYKLSGLKPGKYYWELFKVSQGRSTSVGLGRFTMK